MRRYYVAQDPDGRYLYDSKTDTKLFRCDYGTPFELEIVLEEVLNHTDRNYLQPVQVKDD